MWGSPPQRQLSCGLWGVIHGLEVAWDRGFRRVHVEVDSKTTLQLIEKGVSAVHPLSSLVILCQGFMVRDWVVRFSHIFREGNKVVDSLANFAFSLELGLHCLDNPPPISSRLMLDDLRGVSFPRMMSL